MKVIRVVFTLLAFFISLSQATASIEEDIQSRYLNLDDDVGHGGGCGEWH